MALYLTPVHRVGQQLDEVRTVVRLRVRCEHIAEPHGSLEIHHVPSTHTASSSSLESSMLLSMSAISSHLVRNLAFRYGFVLLTRACNASPLPSAASSCSMVTPSYLTACCSAPRCAGLSKPKSTTPAGL